jgi:hypothetical protein
MGRLDLPSRIDRSFNWHGVYLYGRIDDLPAGCRPHKIPGESGYCEVQSPKIEGQKETTQIGNI